MFEVEVKPSTFEEFPLDWSKIFGNNNPIVVEIGFGNGDFLKAIAERFPEKNFVGFEVSITSVHKTLKKVKDLKNVRLVIADAKFGMREFFGPESVERVIMNFPVPWPKSAHEERRVIIPQFFETLANVLETSGKFELTTDVDWYALVAKETALETGCFEVENYVVNPDREVKTKYEKKWLEQGKDIYSLVLKKIKSKEISRMLGGIQPMPHAKGNFDVEKLGFLIDKTFKNDKKDLVFVIKGVYKALDKNAYIIKVVSSDAGYQQQYYLVVYNESEDNWIIKLDSSSNPFRTPAVKWSVYKLAEELNNS